MALEPVEGRGFRAQPGFVTAPKLILVGRVSGSFGVRGEVRIAAYTEAPAALLSYRSLKREDGSPALTLLSGRAAKTDVIARAAEISTKEQADALRGLQLYVDRAVLPPPEDEDDFYQADLIGLEAATPDGERLGVVRAVLNHGAGDILEIDPGEGRPTTLYPFTRSVVPEVKVGEGRLTIAPPVEVEGDEPGSPLD